MGAAVARQAKRYETRVAPGVYERHASTCAKSRKLKRKACDCTPTYQAKVRVGPADSRSTYSATFSTLAEATAWVEETKANARRGEAPPARRRAPILRDAADEWVARAIAGKAMDRSGKKPFSAATVDNYERALRVHVLEWIDQGRRVRLGDLPADAIDRRTLQAAINGIAEQKGNETARQCAAAAVAVLRDLDRRNIIEIEVPQIVFPSPNAARDQALTVTEADRLLEAAVADDRKTDRSLMAPLVALLIGTGLRGSEALGLRWGPDGLDLPDVGPSRATVARDTTKSDSGARTLYIEEMYATYLRRHRKRMGSRAQDGELVFSREDGAPLDLKGRVRSGFARISKAGGFPVRIGSHVLRHSQGTWLEAAGHSATSMAERLGHADPSTTLRRYVHAPKDDPEAIFKLDEYRRREREAAG